MPFTSLTEPPSARFLFCLPLFPTSQAASPPAPLHFLSYRFRSGGRLGFIVGGQGPRRSVIRKEHNREGSSSPEVQAGGASPPSTHPSIRPSILEFNQRHTIGCHLLPDALAGGKQCCCHKPFKVRRLFKASPSSTLISVNLVSLGTREKGAREKSSSFNCVYLFIYLFTDAFPAC